MGPRVQVPGEIPSSQLSYILNGVPGNESSRLTPYTAYEFQVLARNGAGDVTSDYSEPNTNTLSAGMSSFERITYNRGVIVHVIGPTFMSVVYTHLHTLVHIYHTQHTQHAHHTHTHKNTNTNTHN